MANSKPTVYSEIKEQLSLIRTGLETSSLHQDGDSYIRNDEQASAVLDVLGFFAEQLNELKDQYASLVALFEVEFGNTEQFEKRESIIEISFLEEYLFPDEEKFPLYENAEFQPALLESYKTHLTDWKTQAIADHLATQEKIKNEFKASIDPNSLPCQCASCQGEYRAKLRDFIFKKQVDYLDKIEDQLHEQVLVRKIDLISDRVFEARKNIEKELHEVRYKLKRASLNKLDSDIKSYFKDKFSPDSVLGKVYKEKLRVFFNSCLVEQDLKPELISEEEYQRFFLQLGTNIWRQERFLKREFMGLVNTIQHIKRKDISATILKEYLGQFWLHAEARKIKRRVIYHMGPTNSGKTYHAIEALCKASKGCYLAPLRLLASELYDTMNEKGVRTTLLTGEEVIEIEGASHYSSTIEMAKLNEKFECCVIDEVQMMSDPQRGWAWTRALINIHAEEIHLCGDHSVLSLVEKILKLTGDTLEIKNYTRMTELNIQPNTVKVNELQKGDAVIVFSRRNALKFKKILEDHQFKVSIVYGRLSPEVRREQARKFDQGETDIIVSTDAIAMGMNLPVRRIVFTALSKFIDNKEFPLSDSELKQISGRAGRFGRFPIGYVTCIDKVEGGLERLQAAIKVELPQSDKAMVGPDLEIFRSVNTALEQNSLKVLRLTEFLRLFNTMIFDRPFYCVDLKEMIELAEMVEAADRDSKLTNSESFGFSCAPVNLGLIEHVQFFISILNGYVNQRPIISEDIQVETNNIDYLETAIKCVELYQWLARHFDNNNFSFEPSKLLGNKTQAIERLNELLSDKTSDAQLGRRTWKEAEDDLTFGDRPAPRQWRRRPGQGDQRSESSGPRSGGGGFKPRKSSGGSSGSKNGGKPFRGTSRKPGQSSSSSSGGGAGAAKAFKKHR